MTGDQSCSQAPSSWTFAISRSHGPSLGLGEPALQLYDFNVFARPSPLAFFQYTRVLLLFRLLDDPYPPLRSRFKPLHLLWCHHSDSPSRAHPSSSTLLPPPISLSSTLYRLEKDRAVKQMDPVVASSRPSKSQASTMLVARRCHS